MRVLICGDRNWVDAQLIYNKLLETHLVTPVEVVIEGEARGADTLGRLAAEKLDIPVLMYPARWTEHGRAAGPIRNAVMLKEGKPDLILAFHNNIEESKGTKHMVSIARKAGVPVQVHTNV